MQCKALFFFFIFPAFLSAQNLVPNGSFEDYVSCPEHLDGMEFVEHWYKSIMEPGVDYYLNPSPDYFHVCAINPGLGVPDNLADYQLPVEGDAYCGIVCYSANNPNYRETLGVSLLDPLMSGQTYYCSMYFVRAVDLNGNAGLATNRIGMKFSNVEVFLSSEQAVDGDVHIKFDEVVIDSVNWVLLYGEFTPQQPYQYLHIGNFFTDDETEAVAISETSIWSYYFLDEVRVSTEPLVVTSSENRYNSDNIHAFPNPVDKVLNIFTSGNVKNVQIYSVSGKLIEESIVMKKGLFSLNVEHISKGLYIAVVYFESGEMKSMKINKN